MAKPAVILHPIIGVHVMLLASVAIASNDEKIAIDSDATLSQHQKSAMMRREPPKRASSDQQVGSDHRKKEGNVQLSVNPGGSQVKLDAKARFSGTSSEKIVREHHQTQTLTNEAAKGDSMVEVEDSSEFGSAAEEQEQLARTQASAIPLLNRELHRSEKKAAAEAKAEGPHFSAAAVAALAQETDATSVEEEKKQDEELYYKLFPEERPGAAEAAALLESTTKSFKIRVPVSGGGKKLCLTEDAADRHVRAEPCRRNEKRQKWYWSGSKLQNLHSTGRCLGVDQRKKPKEKTGQFHVQGHSLSMNFKCSLKHAPLAWALTETGQLQSVYNNHCMAINEMEDFSAMALPCGFDSQQKK
jgi:hypothetical protein